ncbi:hypothetical protein B296_00050977 [Ensete ventricosum]|uniref:Uncharacterized protein n=1 Tax=Ensete ventricosum TaxID=4639 RepID=A0A426Y0T3_ENSVE|nr:hypothetical protein B296_00050977 [Ensete ventricosum]
MLLTSSGASGRALCGCVSISSMLCTQWSSGPSSSSWASSSSPFPISFSPSPPLIALRRGGLVLPHLHL